MVLDGFLDSFEESFLYLSSASLEYHAGMVEDYTTGRRKPTKAKIVLVLLTVVAVLKSFPKSPPA